MNPHNHPEGQTAPCPGMWANGSRQSFSPDLNVAQMRRDAARRDAAKGPAWEREIGRARVGGDLDGQWARAARLAVKAYDAA